MTIMHGIADHSVDLIAADLPYSQTCNEWDRVLPPGELWRHYRRILKPNGAIVLTASQPFTTALIASNPEMFRCEWIWLKTAPTNFLNAKRQPLKAHESVLIFGSPAMTYNPQGLIPFGKQVRRGHVGSNYGETAGQNFQEFTNFPRSVLEFPRDSEKLHPTQKSRTLMEYMIKTYSNPGDLVLDNCAGSGTTLVAAINTGRRFIGIEKDSRYHAIAVRRIAEAWHRNPKAESHASSEARYSFLQDGSR